MKRKNAIKALGACKEMKEHYHDLFKVSSKEHRFQLLRADHLRSVLDEILTFTDESLVKAVIENAKERDDLDKCIHAKVIFNKQNT